MEDKEKEILDGVQAQISSFDNKASILLSVVGIIFALTLSFLDVFHSETYIYKEISFKVWYSAIFVIYIIVTVILIASLVLVIIPRNKSKNMKLKCFNYYKDINKMNVDDLKSAIEKSTCNDDVLIEQIKINSKICTMKHYCLKTGAIMFIPFIICMVVMILMVMFA